MLCNIIGKKRDAKLWYFMCINLISLSKKKKIPQKNVLLFQLNVIIKHIPCLKSSRKINTINRTTFCLSKISILLKTYNTTQPLFGCSHQKRSSSVIISFLCYVHVAYNVTDGHFIKMSVHKRIKVFCFLLSHTSLQ